MHEVRYSAVCLYKYGTGVNYVVIISTEMNQGGRGQL